MVVELEVGYCDTRAEDLGWSLDLAPQPALATRELSGDGFLVELRLLGASHQVVVREQRAGPGAVRSRAPLCLETLACLPDRTQPVPAETAIALGLWRYTFNSHNRRYSAGDFDRLLPAIERESEHGILGRYPGLPGAVTAVALRRGGPVLRWSTWHTYPQQGAVVTTHSTLRIADVSVPGPTRPGDGRHGGTGGSPLTIE